MDPKLRRVLSLSPIALSTALALVAAQGVPMPWFTATAYASHCAPPCVCACDCACDCYACVCDACGCEYTDDETSCRP